MATEDVEQNTIAWLLDEHMMAISIGIYVLAVVPIYFWLVGTVGVAGSIGGGVVIASLALGSLMFVPAIMAWLRKKKFELGYAEAQQKVEALDISLERKDRFVEEIDQE